MNGFEFRTQFDLLYNSINSNAAPSLDDFEVSCFLSIAQKAVVENLYKGLSQQGMEANEYTRRALSPILVERQISKSDFKTGLLDSEHFIDKPDNNMLYIISENLKLSDGNCGSDWYIEVKPVYDDDLQRIIKNPFKGIFKNKRALRFDSNNKIVVYCNTDLWSKTDSYIVRYIRRPKPIILDPSNTESIEGETEQFVGKYGICELEESIQQQILTVAVQLAQTSVIGQQPQRDRQ